MTEYDQLIEDLASFELDPLGFALWGFPWGEPNTPLANRSLEAWQIELLTSLGSGLLTPDEAIREAVVSGNGVGKSCIVSIIILWAMTTLDDTRGVVTANTENQLKTKTWAELGKWFNLFIARDLFRLTATSLFSRDPERERTWRIDMVPWSENNIVAFQGLHNEGKRVIVVMDEASAIPDGIHEAVEGCMTDANTQRVWLMCGNPNLPTGRFREACPGGRFASRWKSRTVDSRTVSFTDKKQAQQWIEDYGDDSDFVRVRVKGQFPRTGSQQFMGPELVRAASLREVESYTFDALVIGVDVARFGDDESVIFFRRGRDARSMPPIRRRQVDTMTLAGLVAEVFHQERADAVFVDGGGVGGGVVDRLRQLNVPVIEVQFGGKSDNNIGASESGILYANKRAEIWGSAKEWLKTGAILDLPEMQAQLTGPQYDYNKNNQIQLEGKPDMKKRGLESPDLADAFCLTFAYPVLPRRYRDDPEPGIQSEYDPFNMTEAA